MGIFESIRDIFVGRRPGTAVVPMSQPTASPFDDDTVVIDAEFEEVTGDETVFAIPATSSLLLADEAEPVLALPPPEAFDEAPPELPATFREDLLAVANLITGAAAITATEVDRLAATRVVRMMTRDAALPSSRDKTRQAVMFARIRKADGKAGLAELRRRAAYVEQVMVALGAQEAAKNVIPVTGSKAERKEAIRSAKAKNDAAWLWAALLLVDERMNGRATDGLVPRDRIGEGAAECAALRHIIANAHIAGEKATQHRLASWSGRMAPASFGEVQGMLWRRLESHAVQTLGLVPLVQAAA